MEKHLADTDFTQTFYDRAAELQQGKDLSMLDVCLLSVLRVWMLSEVIQSSGSLRKRNTFFTLPVLRRCVMMKDIYTGLHAFFQRKYVGVTIETMKTLAGTLSEVSCISAFTSDLVYQNRLVLII